MSFDYTETNFTNITNRNSYYITWDASVVEETTYNFDILENTSTSLVTFSIYDIRFTAEIHGGTFSIDYDFDIAVDTGDGSGFTTYTSSSSPLTINVYDVSSSPARLYSANGSYPQLFNINSNTSVTRVDIGAFKGIQNWYQAFMNNANLQQINFVASTDVTGMYITDASWMLNQCSSLTTVTGLNGYKLANCTNFSGMFGQCSGLTTGPSLDTSSGTNFSNMFISCSSITSYPTYDLSNGTNFYRTFYGNNSVTSFPSFDLSSGITAEYMFRDCDSCTTFPAFDTSNISNFIGMFYSCDDLEYLPAYDTSNATATGSFANFVRDCANLECLAGINTSNVIGTPDNSVTCSSSLNTMFQGCTSLTQPTATQQQTIACSGLNYTNSNCP